MFNIRIYLFNFFVAIIIQRILKYGYTKLYIYILNKSENATLQLSIYCEKVSDKNYLLKLNNVFQTSSIRFVETPLICLVSCLSYAPLSV